MAKFCTKCGKKLEDGEICSFVKVKKTTEAKEVRSTTERTTSSGTDFNWYVNSFIDIIKGIIVRPIDTIKKFSAEKYFTLGIIIIILNALLTGVMVYLVNEEAPGFISMMLSLLGADSFSFGALFDVSFMKVLLYVALFMLVGFGVSGLMIYVMAGPLFKTNISIKRTFALIGTCATLTILTTIVAIIAVYISTKAFLVVLLLAGVLYLCHLYHGIQKISNIDENKQGYTFLVAVAVATFAVVYVLPKLLF